MAVPEKNLSSFSITACLAISYQLRALIVRECGLRRGALYACAYAYSRGRRLVAPLVADRAAKSYPSRMYLVVRGRSLTERIRACTRCYKTVR